MNATIASLEEVLDFARSPSDAGGGVLECESRLAVDLLEIQRDLGLRGNLAEIGVKEGKYLVLIAHFLADDEFVFAVDPQTDIPSIRFVHVDKIRELTGRNSQLVSIYRDSRTLTANEFEARNGRKIRYFHIDGNHSEPFVLNDLRLTEQTLAPGGIVALDDYFSFSGVGVSAAAFKYFSERTNSFLVPFMFGKGKMYLTTNGFEVIYKKHFLSRYDRRETIIYHSTWLGWPVLSTALEGGAPRLMRERYPRFPEGMEGQQPF